jgi:hypothetical protein
VAICQIYYNIFRGGKMDIGEIVSDSIMYPSSDWKKVVTLGLLSVISFLIIPIFLVMGYGFRALKSSIAGSEELPDYDEWGDMFVDGLKVFVVEFVYFLIPSIIIFVGVWSSISALIFASSTVDPSAALAGVSMGLLGVTVIIGIILAIAFGLIATIALANMAYNNSELGAAFRFGEILEIISQIGWIDYIIWYIVMIIIAAVGGFIAGILNIIPVIGTIIAILVIYPYLNLVIYRALALIYAYE